ncbi:hypothetical protein C2E31_08100 [Rhodopirellula baltica]|nr:hypothetical protein C2E31_08100 [Rhodopirellula baltica]
MSVLCVRATTATQLSNGRHLWMSQFRKAGLLEERNEAKLRDPALPQSTNQGPWKAIAINAYRTVEGGLFRTFGRNRLNDDGGECTNLYRGVCGTVTLLVPRDSSKSVGRITRLAIDHAEHAEIATNGASTPIAYRTVFLELTSYLYQTAIEYGLTDLEAIVHPRHAKLYKRVFNATPIGKPFACEEVAGALAQLMQADIRDPKQFHPRLRERYLTRSA